MKPFLIGLFGPTASGKSDLAESLADQTGARLISADAFQVYRGLDIGTGKSARRDEYAAIDVVPPIFQMGLGEWLRLVRPELDHCFESGRSVIVVGGTGLYLRALLDGYDDIAGPPPIELRQRLREMPIDELIEELRSKAPDLVLDFNNHVRVRRALEKLETPTTPSPPLPNFRVAKFGIDVDTPELRDRITKRIDAMLRAGWPEEVEALKKVAPIDAPAFAAIGYRQLWNALHPQDAVPEILNLTVRYAKRQRTWMRGEKNLAKIGSEDGRRTVTDWIWGKYG